MVATDLLNDFVFADPLRRLQNTRSNNTFTSGAASSEGASNGIGIYLAGLVMVFIVAFASIGMAKELLSTGSENVVDAPELSTEDNPLQKTPRKSTLAERKQAILELFKMSQVTMVSNDNTMIAGQHKRNLCK